MNVQDDPQENPPSEHALETYTASKERHGLALCLSGGGFRAALFHLGALRRLNELGILSQVDKICSVSGGSILSGYLAQNINEWPMPGEPVADWDSLENGFRRFTRRDLRTGALAKRLWPWNWFRSSTGVLAMMDRYEKHLGKKKLSELVSKPEFIFCATDLAFGVEWVFEKKRAGDYQAGYLEPPPEDWTLAQAIACSSCFPPVFNPMPIKQKPEDFIKGKARREEHKVALSDLRLSDGGVYDNLGLEPVWKTSKILLVSDGGAPFAYESDRGLFHRLYRYNAVMQNQIGALRKRWLISNFIGKRLQGAYWGVGSSTDNYDSDGYVGYSEQLAKNVISKIRTDLDAFSDAEAFVLENHGYTLTAAALAKYQPQLAKTRDQVKPPHPDWMEEARVKHALKDSHRRRLLGRG